jgi:hypothetical protein
MIKRIKDSFDNGVEKIKWFSALVSDRIKVEFSVMKLLYHTDQLEKRREDLMKSIGRRVLELKDNPDRQILKDTIIADAITEIDQITSEIEQTRKRASDISKIEE